MLITDKIFFTSTLLQAAGCAGETFRAWRNRNGLFPETQEGERRWNKFSIVDVMVAMIVTELTKRGMMAQTAVDAGNAAGPVIAEAFANRLSNVDPTDLDQVFEKISAAIIGCKQVLTFNIEGYGERKVSAALQSRRSPVVDNLVGVSIVLDTLLLIVPIFRLKMEGAEIETEAGGRTLVPGLPLPELDPILRAIQAGNWQNAAPEHIPPIGGISKKATTKGKPRGKPRRNAAAKRGQ
ncbi:hypothetical protein LOC51_08685 [Rubrivivax sp. JA1024]|nr:hypothetical protein [Rubrivivax sp. JA1024]